jgi:5-methylcytosine-specific restriction protein A
MAWENSNRRATLPKNWPALREEAARRNPEHVCHRCGRPGGEALDHVNGDPLDHRQENLDWIHDWRSVRDGRSPVNCHNAKTRADRPSLWAPKEQHPCL